MAQGDLVARHEIPPEGVPFNTRTRKAKDPDEQGLLEDHSEEYEGLSPLAMGLLQAGASMMRSGGWRNRPMTTSEAIGYAIPAGIGGYYNQDVRNQQGEAEFYARQLAEQEAQQAQDQLLRKQQQEQLQIQQAIEQLDLIPNSVIRLSAKNALRWQLQQGGKSAQDAMATIIKLTTAESTLQPKWEKVEVEGKDGEVTTKWFDLNAKGANLEVLTKTAPDKITKEQLTKISDSIKDSWPTYHEIAKIILLQPDLVIAHKQMTELINELPQIPSEIAPEDYEKKADAIYNLFKGHKDYIQTVLESANIGITQKERYEKLEAFAKSVDKEGWKRNVQEGALDLQWEKFKFSKEKFGEETEQWQIGNKQKLLQQAIENKWEKRKIQREIYMHNARLGQIAEAQKDGTEYLENEEFKNQFRRDLPSGAFVAEIKDGQVVKFKKEDFTDLTPPKYSDEDMKFLGEELTALYAEYPSVFKEKEQRALGITLITSDPAEALKEAHDILTAKEKTIIPPALILKKYQSDLSVIRNAEQALKMLEGETQSAKDVREGIGFYWGRVTEKFKAEDYQKFKTLATMASLTKRHEMLGSQITEGELKFTKAIFPEDEDTLTSVRVKLQTLLEDAKYNISVTKGMFSEDAGYNPKVFDITPVYKNGEFIFIQKGSMGGESSGSTPPNNYDADFGVTE